MSLEGAKAKESGTGRVKKSPNPSIFDKLFSVYLTPKALKGLKSKGDNFSKIVSEARKLSKR